MYQDRFSDPCCPFGAHDKCAGSSCVLYEGELEDSCASHCMLREACRWIIARRTVLSTSLFPTGKTQDNR